MTSRNREFMPIQQEFNLTFSFPKINSGKIRRKHGDKLDGGANFGILPGVVFLNVLLYFDDFEPVKPQSRNQLLPYRHILNDIRSTNCDLHKRSAERR